MNHIKEYCIEHDCTEEEAINAIVDVEEPEPEVTK